MADHRDTARRVLEVFSSGELDVLDDLFDPGCVVHDTQNAFAGEQSGLDAVRSQIQLYRAGFPDLQMRVEAQYEDGDVVVSRWVAHGTHTGELPALPATNREATVTGILIDRFERDRIAESWINWDTLGMLRQLGAVPG